jgi:hypothetical protein
MAAPTRQHTAANPNPVTAANWNDLQDTFVDILTGNTLANYVYEVASGTGWTVNNAGGGRVIDFEVAGSRKASVTALGQWESTITTGTPPLVVASTTLVPNLHVATAAEITTFDGVASSLYALKTYVLAKTVTWSYQGYLIKSGASPKKSKVYLDPWSGTGRTWGHLRAFPRGASGSDPTTVRARHYDSSGSLLNTETVQITTLGAVVDTAVNSGSGHLMSDGDYILLDISVSGSFDIINVVLSGTEPLSTSAFILLADTSNPGTVEKILLADEAGTLYQTEQ